ncbi:Coiled-coil-helix-coiled-coil-helix domain-containing protein 2, mitochondrial, partial [Melipona quadrifasciata]
RFKTKTSSQPWTNNNQSSTFQTAASTAAGVATGSVIGQAIGSTLAGNVGYVSSANTDPKSNSTNTQELCIPEIRKFFECASRNADLDTCNTYHDMWMKCQNVYKQQN